MVPCHVMSQPLDVVCCEKRKPEDNLYGKRQVNVYKHLLLEDAKRSRYRLHLVSCIMKAKK